MKVVKFTERVDGTARDQAKAEAKGRTDLYIRPEHVAAVLPRRDYTTLIVSGTYVHVTDGYRVVLEKFGMTL